MGFILDFHNYRLEPDLGHLKRFVSAHLLVVASFTEIKTGYRGFEMKQNPVFRMLVLCIEKLFAGLHGR